MNSKYKFCKECPLVNNACLKVQRDKAPKQIMVIGEYPSRSDLNVNKPFTSTASQKFRKYLRMAGFTNEDIYYTTALKCLKPKDKKYDYVTAVDTCSANILKTEIEYYKPKVIIGLGNINLGHFIGQKTGILSKRGQFHTLEDGTLFFPTLTPEYVDMNPHKEATIKKDIDFVANMLKAIEGDIPEQQYFVAKKLDHAKAIIAKLRSAQNFTYDLETTGLDQYTGNILGVGFSFAEYSGAYIPFNHRETLELEQPCTECEATGRVTYIYEDGGIEEMDCQVCAGTTKIVAPSPLIPFWSKDEEEYIISELKSLFKEKGKIKVAHNMSFEDKWMSHHWGIHLDKQQAIDEEIFDTQLYAYERDPYTAEGDRSIALGVLTSKYPDLINLKEIWDPVPADGPHDLSLYHPTEKIGTYCCGDCDGTIRLFNEYTYEIERNYRLEPEDRRVEGTTLRDHFFKTKMPTMLFVSTMHKFGVGVDQEAMADTTKVLLQKEEDIRTEMFLEKYRRYSTKGEIKTYQLPPDFNFNSTPQLRSFFFTKLNAPKLKKPKKAKSAAKVSLEKKVLERMRDQYHIKFAKDLISYREVNKLRTSLVAQIETYLNPVTQRVHADIKQWGTDTGRLSVSRPPLHGTPSRGELAPIVRKILVPTYGWSIIGADYSQIELRICAWLSREPRLLEAYEKELDMHAYTASMLFGRTYEDMKLPEWDWMRAIGKTCNFGLLYGGSPNVLIEQLGNRLIPVPVGVSIEEHMATIFTPQELKKYAEYYHAKFFAMYPGLKHWANRVKAEAKDKGYVRSAYGRIKYLPGINSSDPYMRYTSGNQAVNFDPQSTASDYLMLRFQDIVEACATEGIIFRPLIPIHDALYGECLPQNVNRVEEIIKTVGIKKDQSNIGVPMVLAPKHGYSFAEV